MKYGDRGDHGERDDAQVPQAFVELFGCHGVIFKEYNIGKKRQGRVRMLTSLIGLGGALIGIVLGHFLTKSSQHKQWIRDHRSAEYRELLTALTKSFLDISLYDSRFDADAGDRTKSLAARNDALLIMSDRLYVAVDIARLEVGKRWIKAVQTFRDNHDSSEFSRAFDDIRLSILTAAHKKL